MLYNVDKWGFPKSSAPCVYHWGRAYKKRKYGVFETSYSCCGGEQGSDGCCQATTHVSQNYNPKNLHGYVRTISKDMSSSNKEVYALGEKGRVWRGDLCVGGTSRNNIRRQYMQKQKELVGSQFCLIITKETVAKLLNIISLIHKQCKDKLGKLSVQVVG